MFLIVLQCYTGKYKYISFLKKIRNFSDKNTRILDTQYHDIHLEMPYEISKMIYKFIIENLKNPSFNKINDSQFKNIPSRFQTHQFTLNKFLR